MLSLQSIPAPSTLSSLGFVGGYVPLRDCSHSHCGVILLFITCNNDLVLTDKDIVLFPCHGLSNTRYIVLNDDRI